jgi:hypothetical protein
MSKKFFCVTYAMPNRSVTFRALVDAPANQQVDPNDVETARHLVEWHALNMYGILEKESRQFKIVGVHFQ